MSTANIIIVVLVIIIIIALVIGFSGYNPEPVAGEPILHGFAYGNGSLYQVNMKICFANGELMSKFLEQNPEGQFNITVPCPPFNKTLPEDESGK